MENNIEKNEKINEEISETTELDCPVAEASKKPFPLWIIILAAVVTVAAVALILILTLGNNGGNGEGNNPGPQPPVSGDNGEGNQDPVTLNYTVTVLDELCNPVSDVIIKFTDKEGNTKIKKTDSEGIAILADAALGNYNITVDTATSKVTVSKTEYTLTEKSNSLIIYAKNTNNTVEISGDVEDGEYANIVTVGDYSVHTNISKTTFLYFNPSETGIYHFTITGSTSESNIGYYGLPDDVQLINIGDYDEETKTLTLVISHTEVAHIIGVDSETNDNVEISIKRVGNAPYYIYGDVEEGTTAENVGAGTHTFVGEAGKTSYAVFNPGITGVYKVSFLSDDIAMTVGYYGIPMFVQSTHRGEGEYDGKTFELIIHDAATPYVIGLNFTIDCTADLVIERISDAPFDPQFAPWTNVPASANVVKCQLPANSTLVDLDITDPTLSVVLGDDGYYYTSDGKLVYIRINSLGDARYLDASLAYIYGISGTDSMTGAGGLNFGGYVYDDNGEFVGKYSFNDMLKTYYDSCSPEGVCPLTAELAEAMKINGNGSGWWKFGTANYLFNGVPVVIENAWLFLCCTVE